MIARVNEVAGRQEEMIVALSKSFGADIKISLDGDHRYTLHAIVWYPSRERAKEGINKGIRLLMYRYPSIRLPIWKKGYGPWRGG